VDREVSETWAQTEFWASMTVDHDSERSLESFPALLCRFKTTKIEQNIVTGGANKTSTAILKFLMKKGLFDPPSEARHMEH
jgi:hypothetical protein